MMKAARSSRLGGFVLYGTPGVVVLHATAAEAQEYLSACSIIGKRGTVTAVLPVPEGVLANNKKGLGEISMQGLKDLVKGAGAEGACLAILGL